MGMIYQLFFLMTWSSSSKYGSMDDVFFLFVFLGNLIHKLCDNNHPRISHWNMTTGKPWPGKRQHTTRGAVPNQACGILCGLMTRSWDTKQGILELRHVETSKRFQWLQVLGFECFISFHSKDLRTQMTCGELLLQLIKRYENTFSAKNILQVNSLGKHTKVSWWLQHI